MSYHPENFGFGSTSGSTAGATLASGTTITPTCGIHHISGTSAIKNITLPWAGFTGTIALIPDDAFTTATGGTDKVDIANASTAVANKTLFMTYDGEIWHGSY